MFKTRSESETFFWRIKRKVLIFTLLVTAGFFLLVMRMWHLQVVQHDTLSSKAESNRVREIQLDGLRGKIVDRNGITLVDSRPSFQLSLIPEDMDKRRETLEFLNASVPFDVEETIKKIKVARPFKTVVLKRDISREEVAFVEEKKIALPGIFLEVKPIRNYANGSLGAHLVGYLGSISPSQLKKSEPSIYSRDDLIGKSGVEKMFEKTLRGGKGFKRVEVDAAGRELRSLAVKFPKSGEDIKLTIDYATQKAAEDAFGDKMGSAVAIDPTTGDVLAYVSKPSFDPNTFAFGIKSAEWKALLADEFHPLQNRGVQGQYPPGSTYKVVVALAALEEKIITPETTVYCPGHFRLGRRSYRCWKKWGHGDMDVHKALVQSCDVFFYNVGLKLGIDTIAKYAKMMGLGQKTGVNIANEKSGLVPTTEWKKRARKEPWILGETISCSIGQGFNLTTPIQLARMVSAIANGGKIITPRITIDKDNIEPIYKNMDVAQENLNIINNALRGVVVDDHGTAWRIKKGPYKYAGKTGTVQLISMKPNEEWVHEDVKVKHRDHALFVSYAPYDNAKIAVAVIAEHAGHGGEAAAPIAKLIMDAYLSGLEKEKGAAEPVANTGSES